MPQKLRNEIEKTDRKLLTLLAHRASLSHRIGKMKAERGMPVYDRAREQALTKMHREVGMKLGLDASFVKKIFTLVLSYSRKLQKKRS